jgi:hypothetical protein
MAFALATKSAVAGKAIARVRYYLATDLQLRCSHSDSFYLLYAYRPAMHCWQYTSKPDHGTLWLQLLTIACALCRATARWPALPLSGMALTVPSSWVSRSSGRASVCPADVPLCLSNCQSCAGIPFKRIVNTFYAFILQLRQVVATSRTLTTCAGSVVRVSLQAPSARVTPPHT